jgi:hypothetical protein
MGHSRAAIVWAIAGVLAETARAVSAMHAPEETGWTVAACERRADGRYHLGACDRLQTLAAVGADDLPLVLLAFPTAGLVETAVFEAQALLLAGAAVGAVALRATQIRSLPRRLAFYSRADFPRADVPAGPAACRVGPAVRCLPGAGRATDGGTDGPTQK